MNQIKVGVGALNQTPFAWDANKQNILRAIADAQREGVDVLCLPEMCITGYGCEDAFFSPALHQTALDVLHEIIPSIGNLVISLSLPLSFGGALYNCACIASDCSIAGFVAKRFLAAEGIHYEPRWFRAWQQGRHDVISIRGQEYPFGDLYFDWGGVKIGYEICEDAWVAKRPGHLLAAHNVDLILNPSASHFSFAKHKQRARFITEGSRSFGVGYLYANLVGNESGRIIYDGGSMIASAGRIIATGPRLSFAECTVTSAVVDIDELRTNRPAAKQTVAHCHKVTVPRQRGTHNFSEKVVCPPLCPPLAASRWERSIHEKEEEFTRAIALGLFDYMRKSKANGAVISISGGADSAACACLFRLSIELAVAELGLVEVLARLNHIPNLESIKNAEQLTNRLLLCVYQATRNSTKTTQDAAQSISEAIDAEFLLLNVDSAVDGYVSLVANAIGRKLTWSQDDIALQNIQARSRAPSVWLLANLRGALLLSTSNRSEAAVGYATMDGDTCGGLSPIAGIDKAFLIQWLRWLQRHGPDGLFSVPALASITNQRPTAELRPPSAQQTDEEDLMPYDLLNAIEGAAIRDKCAPLEVFQQIRLHFPQYGAKQLGVWITSFFRLWCQNQWKRERYAPSFHVDDKNLDPKTWCRFPILSGGFHRELAEMQAYIDHVKESLR